MKFFNVWKFNEPKNVAVFTTINVANGKSPILCILAVF